MHNVFFGASQLIRLYEGGEPDDIFKEDRPVKLFLSTDFEGTSGIVAWEQIVRRFGVRWIAPQVQKVESN